ncbi:MAG: ComF family protein [Legionellaceae bacterium]
MDSISHLLHLPTYCTLCTQQHRGPWSVCLACASYLLPLGPACKHCATPLPNTTLPLCGPCAVKQPAIDTVFTSFRFEEPLRGLLHDFKYNEQLHLGGFFADLIVKALNNDALQTECLIPVPMHPKRLKERGFNQAALLTQHIAQRTKKPYTLFSCKKLVHTAQQAHLNARTRQMNLNNAFSSKPLPYQHVTLIDDLITTGSTANALASCLKRTGIRQVDVWCCAKTVF